MPFVLSILLCFPRLKRIQLNANRPRHTAKSTLQRRARPPVRPGWHNALTNPHVKAGRRKATGRGVASRRMLVRTEGDQMNKGGTSERRVAQPARERWELGELVRAGGAEGVIVGRSCWGPQSYCVQFDSRGFGKLFAPSELTSVA